MNAEPQTGRPEIFFGEKKMRRHSIQIRLVLGTALLCFGAGTAWASERPVAVSPGSATGTQIGDACPTFSWGAVPGGKSYELVVYRVAEGSEEARPVLRETLSGSASSWTPSLERCLERGGQYGWSVRAVGQKEGSEWSPPSLFQVASGPGEAELEEALAVVRQYLAGRNEVIAATAAGGPPASSETRDRASAEAPRRSGPATTLLSVAGNLDAVSFSASGTITSGTSITIDGTSDTLTATGGTISFDDENLTTTGTVTMSGFTLATGASEGAVLSSNASGVGTWQAAVSPNLWETLTADAGSTSADTQTDTLNIAGSGTVTTAIAGDTLTISGSAAGQIAQIADYGSSTSFSTTRSESNFKIAYGHVFVSGLATVTISNLPFTDASTFSVAGSYNLNDFNVVARILISRTSASQISITNSHPDTREINWIAMGI